MKQIISDIVSPRLEIQEIQMRFCRKSLQKIRGIDRPFKLKVLIKSGQNRGTFTSPPCPRVNANITGATATFRKPGKTEEPSWFAHSRSLREKD